MRLVTLKCNGIRAAEKKGLSEYLAALSPDVLCLQEVRAATEQIPATFQTRSAYWLPAEKGGYSGVGLVTEMPVRRLELGLGDAQFDAEGRVQRCDFEDWTLVNVYIPSGSSGEARQVAKYQFLEIFSGYIAKLISEQPRVVICGDFNIAHHSIDLKNWKTNQKTSGFLPEERAWLTRFQELGLVDVVRQLAGPEQPVYSWWSQRAGARQRDVGWRLDYHWATPAMAAEAHRFEIPRLPIFSDHAPVVVDYHWPKMETRS